MYDRTPFQLARSDYLDACYSVESEIIRLLVLGGFEIKSDCLGAKLKTLSGIKPSSKLSKATVADVVAVCALLQPFLPARADIVHSQLEVIILSGVPQAVFANARQDRGRGSLLRAFTYDQLLQEGQLLRQHAARLNALGQPKVSQGHPAKSGATPQSDAPQVVPIRA